MENPFIISFLSLTVRPPGRLDEVVSEKDVVRIAGHHLVKWKPLAPFLGLNPLQEKEICIACSGNSGRQKVECLDVWKAMQGNRATYAALITAAEKAEDMKLAYEVRAMLKE